MQKKSSQASTCKPLGPARWASLAQPPGPHPDLVPELLSLLSQLLQLTHGAGLVGRGWGRLGAAGRGLGEAAPRLWPEACGDRTLRRVAKGAREVLSSSAAEAATRMDFLSHLNSTGRRCSPQSGGIPPASDAAVAAAPRARLGETNCLVGGGRKGKHHLRGTD